MANVEKVSIALTPEMATLVRQAVETGDYASASEAIRDALREWKQRRLERAQAMEEVGRRWDQGVASGPGRFESIEAIKAEAHQRLRALAEEIDLGPFDWDEWRGYRDTGRR